MMRPAVLLAPLLLLAASDARAEDPLEQAIFDTHRLRLGDLSAKDVLKTLPPKPARPNLGFDPTQAKLFDVINKELALTPAELALFEQNGFVSIDHQQRYSFGSTYYAIYARDLPVLITSDSIMHAVHVSYDDILIELEIAYLAPTIAEVLEAAHDRLKKGDEDVDVYLTVARRLLAGVGTKKSVASRLGQDDSVEKILAKVAKLELETPQSPGTMLYGRRRPIDYSQFRPRGHYTKSEALKRYFRAMMWIGRVDTGYELAASDRELAAALRFVTAVHESGGLPKLAAMNDIIDYLVGKSDNLGPAEIVEAMKGGASSKKVLERLRAKGAAHQKIRSQVLVSNPRDTNIVEPPIVFQLFGQRFVVDSFVLSQVVFDSIIYKKRKVKRYMPSGLDVMAALGNDEAVRLLARELRTHPYGANLMAARHYIDDHNDGFWKETAYSAWLASLRTLDDEMHTQKNFPRAMQTDAWRHKQLQTQLASWAELRHDTILYAKQSYTIGASCEYPGGYVEPYPAFYEALRTFGQEAARRIGLAHYPASSSAFQDRHVAYFERLATITERLRTLAVKELAAEAFSGSDEAWLKKTIDRRGGGSGPPRYDGWYADLYYGGGTSASKWEPTVADVHTDPNGGKVLEVAVGDVNFGVIAIDNGDDVQAYVGPLFSYYEFSEGASNRLTDEQWQQRISRGKQPKRPSWTKDFQPPSKSRHMGR